MNGKLMLAELLLSGFFAIACIRAHGPIASGEKMTFGEFFRFPDRLSRLKRSRWQWASMVALMLILRLQQQVPLVLEILVAAEFLLFLSFPSRSEVGMSRK